MSSFFITEDDDNPAIQTTITDADGNAIDLSGYTTYFNLRPFRGSTASILQGATTYPNTGTDGVVRYSWATVDTATPGVYEAEWTVYSGSTRLFTAPNDGYDTVVMKTAIA